MDCCHVDLTEPAASEHSDDVAAVVSAAVRTMTQVQTVLNSLAACSSGHSDTTIATTHREQRQNRVKLANMRTKGQRAQMG
jgi:hypothetical protein